MKKLLSISVVTLVLGGCASYAPFGVLYTKGATGVAVNNNVAPTKEGKACMNSVLGLVAWGDASIEAAKRNAQIKDVATMDYKAENILGIYGEYCIVVKGQ